LPQRKVPTGIYLVPTYKTSFTKFRIILRQLGTAPYESRTARITIRRYNPRRMINALNSGHILLNANP
ncbi:MAG: hypothetical protein ACK5DL_07515, partial [Burkholderiales bacterium]